MASDAKRWRWLGAAALVVLVGLALLVVLLPWRAKVKGATPAERIACICRLADGHRWGAVDAIAAAAAEDPDASVRRAAVLCLGKFHRPTDRNVVEACTRDAAPRVREAAAMTLARYADPRAADRLAEMARDDDSEPVCLAAAVALDLQGGPAALVALVDLMEKSHQVPVREQAGKLLVKKFGVIVTPNPNDSREWLNLIEMIRGVDSVRAAYQQLDRPLESHPENLIPQTPNH